MTALPRHSIFVDTSAFFALADRSDRYHRTTVTLNYRHISSVQHVFSPTRLQSNTSSVQHAVLVTSNFIVCETLTLIRMRLGYAAAIQFGKRLRDESTTPVAFIEPTDEQEAWRIFQRYKDHRFSFVDCTSFAIMKRMKLNTVLAFDEDFLKLESGSSFHRSTAIYIGIRNATHSSDVLNTVGVQRVSYHHATGPYFQHALSPGQGQALVYFYRPPLSEVPSRYSTWIYVDYQFIGKLDHGGYFFSILSSGRHRISNSPNDTSEDLA